MALATITLGTVKENNFAEKEDMLHATLQVLLAVLQQIGKFTVAAHAGKVFKKLVISEEEEEEKRRRGQMTVNIPSYCFMIMDSG